MAKTGTFDVTLKSPDGKHLRVVHMEAFDADHAREIAERQAQDLAIDEAAAAGHDEDAVTLRKATQKLVYTVDSIEEA